MCGNALKLANECTRRLGRGVVVYYRRFWGQAATINFSGTSSRVSAAVAAQHAKYTDYLH